MPTTPNMNLILPTPTVTVGPTYASQNNTAFDTVDAHDHTSGKGVQVPSAGIGINADLPMNNYNLTEVRSIRYEDQAAPIAVGTDVGCTYVAGGNLYFNDVSGTQIQLTAGGALNAASIGGIGGDYTTSTASVYYQSIDNTFYFTQNTNTPATLNAGSIIVREPVVSSNSITVQSPTSLASSYTVTLPAALPASSRVLSLSSTGVLATGVAGTVQTIDLGTASVTPVKMSTINYVQSAANNATTLNASTLTALASLTGTITGNSNRAIKIKLMQASNVSAAAGLIIASTSGAVFEIAVTKNAGVDFFFRTQVSGSTQYSPAIFEWFDPAVSGATTYEVYYRVIGASGSLDFQNVGLLLQEV